MLTLGFIFLVAWLLDLLIGDPQSARHPVALFGRLAGWMENFCRRLPLPGFPQGLLAWALLVLPVASMAGLSVRLAGYGLPEPAAAMLAGVWLYWCIALRSLIDHAQAVRRPLRQNDLPAARLALSRLVSRDTATLGESEIVRGGIESLGENLIDAVNSAFFWSTLGFLLAGAPGAAAGAVLLRSANTLDACWGYRSERYRDFGRAAARLDDFCHFLPARLSLPVIGLAARLAGYAGGNAVRTGWRHRRDHPSPNSAWGMAAFAGALQLRLGGPTGYGGKWENYPYYGNGRARLTPGDLRRAERLAVASALLFTLFCFLGGGLCLNVI